MMAEMALTRRNLLERALLGAALPAAAQDSPTAEAIAGRDNIRILLGGRPYTTLHCEEEWDKPFVHPLSTPSGVVVTRGFPVAALPGESDDHAWHRGAVWGHGLVNGYDFWRELGREKTARLVLLGVPAARRDGDRAGADAWFAMTPPGGPPIGTCRQIFLLRQTAQGIEISAQIQVRADKGQPLVFGDTEDGGFGLRFHDAFRQDRGAKLLNSDGLVGSENIWGKRARWVQYSTAIEGKPVSVTMFDHPRNFRHPTYWHARGYGFCAANPFGLHDFLGDDSQDGSHTIAAGGQLVLRYRLLVSDGVPPAPE